MQIKANLYVFFPSPYTEISCPIPCFSPLTACVGDFSLSVHQGLLIHLTAA